MRVTIEQIMGRTELESRLYAFSTNGQGEKRKKISKRVLPDVESIRVLLSKNLFCRVKSVAVVHRFEIVTVTMLFFEKVQTPLFPGFLLSIISFCLV